MTTDGPRLSILGDHKTQKNDPGEQSNRQETTWTNTEVVQSDRGQRIADYVGGGMLMYSRNHCILRLHNDDDDDYTCLLSSS